MSYYSRSLKDRMFELGLVIGAALLCIVIGFSIGHWQVENAAAKRVAERQAMVDSLDARLRLAMHDAAASAKRADSIRVEFVQDSASAILQIDRLLAQITNNIVPIDGLTAPTEHQSPPPKSELQGFGAVTPLEVTGALSGCKLAIGSCSQALSESQRANEQLRQSIMIANSRDSVILKASRDDARRFAAQLAEAKTQSRIHDVKVGGITAGVILLGCAASHVGNPFGATR